MSVVLMLGITFVGAAIIGAIISAVLCAFSSDPKEKTFSSFICGVGLFTIVGLLVMMLFAVVTTDTRTMTIIVKDKCCSMEDLNNCVIIDSHDNHYSVTLDNYNRITVGDTYVVKRWTDFIRELAGEPVLINTPILKSDFRSCEDSGISC